MLKQVLKAMQGFARSERKGILVGGHSVGKGRN